MIKRLLLRLYPRAWRERYGVELQALLDDSPPRRSDLWDLLKSALMLRMAEPTRMMVFALAGVAVCHSMMFGWHALVTRPVSDATLALPPTATQPTDVSQALMQLLGDQDRMRGIIQRHQLLTPPETMESAVVSVWRHFRIAQLSDRKLSIGFAHSDPAKAQAVANEFARVLAKQLDAHIERAPTMGRPPEVLPVWIAAASLLGLCAGVLFARRTRVLRL